MGELRPWHIIVVAGVLVLLFGAKRLPEAARSLGRSMRILKAETRGLGEDDVKAQANPQSDRQLMAGHVDDDQAPPTTSPVQYLHHK
jgi:sec-independent protein translocase protein TatA